ncbi:class I SAM-dependent methyltransferase [Sphingomonas oryzagri]|jgi:trans-aconitate methyltransferase|uniref:Methyltransferase domain-containing protein n=1 Tax=Sphingomonas oryzagri TaxID=3042314 RepID=A0ABT6MZJ5_9SPHN|nr:class I SAM-dependent methyltransferase [Sphingomonas oryzagri]MDH7637521.1 methyltransferase domain-containing protein [Sphingomonas oryzagri]
MSVNATSRWDAEDYKKNAAFVPALGAPVVDLLAPKQGEHILDLGCGDGILTEKLVAAGAVVVAVDASAEMIAAARARGLDAHVMDGQALVFGPEFDAVFSNAALHWMLDAPAVAKGVYAALKPGGRFVGEMGGQGNIATLRAALHAELQSRGYQTNDTDPQWYAAPDEFMAVYEAAGFTDISATLIPRPTPLPAGVRGWLHTFRTGFLDAAGVPDAEQDDVAQAVESRLEAAFRQPDGSWLADYVRLRFSMRKPA